jgi:hypothetical protein
MKNHDLLTTATALLPADSTIYKCMYAGRCTQDASINSSMMYSSKSRHQPGIDYHLWRTLGGTIPAVVVQPCPESNLLTDFNHEVTMSDNLGLSPLQI